MPIVVLRKVYVMDLQYLSHRAIFQQLEILGISKDATILSLLVFCLICLYILSKPFLRHLILKQYVAFLSFVFVSCIFALFFLLLAIIANDHHMIRLGLLALSCFGLILCIYLFAIYVRRALKRKYNVKKH